MSDVRLKPKVTLKVKQKVGYTFEQELKIKLFWMTDTDLDLCIFFKKKDGEIGGIFSDEYNQRKKDLGSLDEYPWILHSGDDRGPDEQKKESLEAITVKRMDYVDTAYICIVNYKAARNGSDVTFKEHNGKVHLLADSGDFIEVMCDSDKQGTVFVVAKIENDNGHFFIQNENSVMDISTAYDKIPGFSLICNAD